MRSLQDYKIQQIDQETGNYKYVNMIALIKEAARNDQLLTAVLLIADFLDENTEPETDC
jgi:hypothetical protein